ncbi:peptide/nickel transport system substrate-binding protein [Antricoccus suffuscus]|uniref:Peptide/nickel transport system substrate-binding protein n=1 Tax=Antricoccus suffuscus TaxID=1629062 RepID=A0A2T1A002_9ACTN|nr:ABC transporter substrate-binding protein [Antricoccus suffuscus]PRZ41668.1 peptide/nickel transport system substrate-binding protein [Antricoccus suffuscus]
MGRYVTATNLSRRVRAFTAIATSALLLAACGGAPDRDSSDLKDEFSNTIKLASDYDPNGHFAYSYSVMTPGWDPIESVSGYDFVTLAPVYDRLVFNAPDGSVQPMLATDWESADDGKALVFTLRKDVTFSDGTPFNAEAVKINLDRARGEGSRIATEIEQLDAVEVVDGYTVKLVADTGVGALLGALAQRPGMMASPAAIAGGTLKSQPVGAGAYTLTGFTSGDKASYAKREGYWEPDAQRVATMEIKLITDDQTRLNALKSGDIDGAVMRPEQVKSAVKDGLKVTATPSVVFMYLTVNSAKAPFDNPKVLEALNYAIDREAIGNGYFEGMCVPQIQPWPESSFAYSEEIGNGLDVWPHDPKKAKQLFEEAGVGKGFDLPTVTTNVTYTVQLSEVLQEMLAEVGVKMTIEQVPTPQVIEAFSVSKTVAGNVNPYSGSSDPHGVASRHLMPGSIYSVGNPVAQSTLDLAVEAATPIDPEKRTPIYAKMMQDMVDNPNHLLPICQLHVISVFNDSVSGFGLSPSGFPDLRGVAVS